MRFELSLSMERFRVSLLERVQLKLILNQVVRDCYRTNYPRKNGMHTTICINNQCTYLPFILLFILLHIYTAYIVRSPRKCRIQQGINAYIFSYSTSVSQSTKIMYFIKVSRSYTPLAPGYTKILQLHPTFGLYIYAIQKGNLW